MICHVVLRCADLLKVQPWQLGAEGKKCYCHPLLRVFMRFPFQVASSLGISHHVASFRIISLMQFLGAWRCIRRDFLIFLGFLTNYRLLLCHACPLPSQKRVSLNGSCKERLGHIGILGPLKRR